MHKNTVNTAVIYGKRNRAMHNTVSGKQDPAIGFTFPDQYI